MNKFAAEWFICLIKSVLYSPKYRKHPQILNKKNTNSPIKIQQILHDYVRPAVEQDGGAISYKSFDEGVVTVELRGSCSGCPSSTITLKSGIQNLLQRMVPEVKEVVSEAL